MSESPHKPDSVELQRKLWMEEPWPWELEFLTLLTAIGGAFLALRYEIVHMPEYRRLTQAFEMDITANSWLIITLVAYAGHLLLSRTALREVSTPFHLVVSPSLFALMGFFNFHSAFIRSNGPLSWEWPWVELFLLLLGISALCLLLARVRMQRVMLPFRDMRWDIELSPAARRSGEALLPLLSRIHPVLYPPYRYRANAAGIEIEGLFYVSLISYAEINGISIHRQGDWASSGVYLTRSMRDLVQIHLKGRQEPLVLAPEKAQAFAEYTIRRLREFQSNRGN